MDCCHAIDTHAHLWTDEYLNELKRLGAKSTEVACGIGAGTNLKDLDKRLKMMDDAGVEYQVLSATPQVPQFGTKEEALNLAMSINNTYKDIILKYPDRFRAYGVVPLPHIEEAINEGKRIINELGFLGIALNTTLENGMSIGNSALEPFFEAMNEIGAIIYIHPTGSGAFSPMLNDYNLEWVVGAPVEDMLATLQLLKKEIPQKYPNLKFHIAHLGGGISFQMQRIMDNYEDWKSFKYSPIETIKKSFYFDTANFLEESLVHSNKIIGNERLLLGSDFPYFQNEKYTRAVTYIKNSSLTDSEKNNILTKNAQKLYSKTWQNVLK